MQVNISAIVEFDTDEFDANEVDSAITICFRVEDKYGEEVFIPKWSSLNVVEYQDVNLTPINKDL